MPGLLSAAELAQIQADAVAVACDQSCQIQRKATTQGSTYGQQKDTYTTVATVNAGMTQPTAGQLQNFDYLIGSLAAWQVKFPVGTDVRTQDHLLIGGKELVVQRLLQPRSYQVLLTVLASEVE